ncbi:MAG TPA: GAF domain-containing sensor histidine kinase [Solirubrobacterales bacterium]|nr:GAF domain-containing sensor histidine kinase [Solirubrobacterales bacterium]
MISIRFFCGRRDSFGRILACTACSLVSRHPPDAGPDEGGLRGSMLGFGEILSALSTATLNADVALRALARPATKPSELAELCREALDVDAVIFWTRRGRQLQTFAIAPESLDEVSVDMRVGHGVAGKVAESGEPVILHDMLNEGEMRAKGLDLSHSGIVEEHEWRGGMFVPVTAGRRMAGIFGAYSKTPGTLKRGLQQDVFGAFANRVASELHRDAISDEFDRVTALGLAAIDRAHSVDNANFILQGQVNRLQKLYNRRLELKPDFATPEIRRTMTSILEQSSHLGSNFEALIHVDRLRRESKIRMQSITKILENVIARQKGSAEAEKIELQLRCQPNVVAFVRKNDLDRVIDNLIINAIHFHPFNEGVTKRYIRVVASHQGEPPATVITVEDNGPGIEEKHLPYVFDLMWASPDHGGSGFGLFFARRIVEAFGGTIDVESIPYKKTRFRIELTR